MEETRYHDIIGGSLLVAGGAAAAIYSYMSFGFEFGGQVGPGVFPVSLGIIISVLGLIILLTGLNRVGRLPAVEWRSLGFVLGAVATFAMLVDAFGMVPSVIVTVLVSCLADKRTSLRKALVLSVALAALCVAVFNLGLGVQIKMIDWPF